VGAYFLKRAGKRKGFKEGEVGTGKRARFSDLRGEMIAMRCAETKTKEDNEGRGKIKRKSERRDKSFPFYEQGPQERMRLKPGSTSEGGATLEDRQSLKSGGTCQNCSGTSEKKETGTSK